MRSRKAANEQVAEVARRRLELLAAELATASRPLPPPAPEAPAPLDQPAEPSDLPPGRHARRSVGSGALLLGWLHDRLPPTLQGRVQLGSSHLTVVALLVAAALAVTAWWVIRADGDGTVVPTASGTSGIAVSDLPVAAPAASASQSPPGIATGAPTGAPTGSSSAAPAGGAAPVVVDVAGKVRRPGIATLPVGSRVVDALKAAGGARRGVDTTGLNLARVLVDGEQIVVGVPPPPGVAAPAASAPGTAPSAGPMVNLNTATQAQLETLPGVGPVTAESILAWRTDNGGFTSVDELLEVDGIGEATLADLAPLVTL